MIEKIRGGSTRLVHKTMPFFCVYDVYKCVCMRECVHEMVPTLSWKLKQKQCMEEELSTMNSFRRNRSCYCPSYKQMMAEIVAFWIMTEVCNTNTSITLQSENILTNQCIIEGSHNFLHLQCINFGG